MNNLFNRPWVYKVISLIFALGLFAYVNVGRLSTTRGSTENNQQVLATKKASVKVPLEVQSDTNRYFITGYPEKVTVHLEGPSALVTTTVNTQNFKVIADLRNLSVGKHVVKLTQQGINKELAYRVAPKYITVDIQPKQTRKFPIQLQFNQESVAEGYKIGTARLSQETVTATGSKTDINKVSQVIANVSVSKGRKTDVDQEVLLQAVDSSGKIVNVLLDPQTVHVNIPIYLPSKNVALDFSQTGTVDKTAHYDFASDSKTVKVYGVQSVLDKLKKLTVPVDVTGATGTINRTVKINLKDTGLDSVDPNSIQVIIKVTKTGNSDTSDSQQSNASTAGSQSASQQSASSDAQSTASSSSTKSSSSSSSSTQQSSQDSSDDQ
ncbi:MAG: CdaR family protein [Lactobacillus sp.]|nr:CdaR family protein [Lactobacillus sp.]